MYTSDVCRRSSTSANHSWNRFYKREIENFNENDQDTGECWFDDCGAEQKVIDFFLERLESGELGLGHNLKLLDLGTGNGHFLFELHAAKEEEEIDAALQYTGIDYSPESIDFAKLIALRKFSEQKFDFDEVDFISQHCTYISEKSSYFDVVFDKGTLDAIALNNDPVEGFDGKIGIQVYPLQVAKMMHTGSILLITSCNFTEEELIKVITNDGKDPTFTVWEKLQYPSFQFGGQMGSTICTIAFKKS